MSTTPHTKPPACFWYALSQVVILLFVIMSPHTSPFDIALSGREEEICQYWLYLSLAHLAFQLDMSHIKHAHMKQV